MSTTNTAAVSSADRAALRGVFQQAVRAVQPAQLFAAAQRSTNSAVHYDHGAQVLRVGKAIINLAGKRCHLVGFGKAVRGMAAQMERILGDRLMSGLLSVPIGQGVPPNDPGWPPQIEVCEGAADNLPDERAAQTARRIFTRCQRMDATDVLIVLISGGGSALLPLPIGSVTIAEKQSLCRQLAAHQATINEINTVRTALSLTKGGKLAAAARDASAIVTLVISDVCGDPLEVIASGPTIVRRGDRRAADALNVLRKFQLWSKVPVSVRAVLEATENVDEHPPDAMTATPDAQGFDRRAELIMGSNTVACEAAATECVRQQMLPIIISTVVDGDVALLAETYVQLAEIISAYRRGQCDDAHWLRALDPISAVLHISAEVCVRLSEMVQLARNDDRAICVVAGGEPTVRVLGTGRGGRSQELALRVSQRLAALRCGSDVRERVMFLAAGTDGIDGPTEAAGAFGCAAVGGGGLVQTHIDNNDAYTLYSELGDGEYHVVTGHTGTNVMDVHLLLVR